MNEQVGNIPNESANTQKLIRDKGSVQEATEEGALPELNDENVELLTANDIERINQAEVINTDLEKDERALFEATVLDTIEEAVAATDATEAKASAQMTKNIGALAETVASLDAPSTLFEDAPSFIEDATHAFVGTAPAGIIRRAFNRLIGRPSQAPQEREHFGIVGETIRGIPGVARTLPETALSGMANIARDVAQRFNEWSPETIAKRAHIAQEAERAAEETLQRVLAHIHEARSNAPADITSWEFSQEEYDRSTQLADAADNAKRDHAEAVTRAREIAPNVIESALKQGTWAAASVSLDVLSFTVGIGGIVEEAGRNFLKGVRGERKKLIEERMIEGRPLDTHENTVITRMERLGDLLATKAAEMKEDHESFVLSIHRETSFARHREIAARQRAIEQRIAFFTERTKLTKTDLAEIAKLTSKLAAAREGSLGAQEINVLIEQAQNLGDSRKEDERTLMGYIAGRAINSLKNLTVLPPEVRNTLITELQKNPSPEALKVVETTLYVALDENASLPGVTMSEDDKEHARLILLDLKEHIQHATDTYNASISKISGEIAKAFQAANRDTKKATARAAAAPSSERMAA